MGVKGAVSLLFFTCVSSDDHEGGHGVCRSRTFDEIRQELLDEAGCPDAEPTSCYCVNHHTDVVHCPGPEVTLWESTGKTCIHIPVSSDASWTPHMWYYPSDYWTYCPPIRGGRAGSHPVPPQPDYWIEPGTYQCTTVEGFVHEYAKGSPGYNAKYNSVPWCSQPGCYVNPCTCNMRDIAVSVSNKRRDGGRMYYSYAMCGGVDVFTSAICDGMDAGACAKSRQC